MREPPFSLVVLVQGRCREVEDELSQWCLCLISALQRMLISCQKLPGLK
jgi:hypothetical protein